MTAAILAVIGYIALIAIIARCLRANGDDTPAQDAADSVRAALESDARLDDLNAYTQRPHKRAGSAWGKQP